MYFQRFPRTYYTLDDLNSVQLVTNIMVRVIFSDEIKNNLSVYDEYDIRDGETPEILADIFYDNPELHWIILHTNEILDPRFEWPLSQHNFNSYIQSKYTNVNGVHHYEDSSGNYVNGNVFLMSSSEYGNVNVGSVITNFTSPGNAVVVAKQSTSNIQILVSDGGFVAGDVFKLASNTAISANITSTSIVAGIPVTNLSYEDTVNESRRRIKILKPQFIDAIIKELNKKLET